MSRPITLSVAVILQWIAATVAIVSGLDLVAAAFSMSRSGISEKLETTLQQEGVTDIAGSLMVLGVFLAGVLIITVALFRIVVAAYVWQGRSWARIVLTVLIALNIVGGLAYLFEGYVMRMLFTVPVDILVLWLIFNERSSSYIKKSTKVVAQEVTDVG